MALLNRADRRPPPISAVPAAPETPAGDPPVIAERPIPAQVSAAWELELLVAGAVTFALFQLPPALSAALAWAEPRATGAMQFTTFFVYVYAKAIVYVLIVAFLLNLVTRAYWVGLVGLHSVFPGGVRWDQLGKTMGPISVGEYRARLKSLPDVIARVDNFASVIFSFAFLVVLTFVLSVLAMGAVGGVALGVSTLLGGGYVAPIIYTSGLVLLVPMVAAGLLDKLFGAKLPPESRGGRMLRGLARFAAVASGMRLVGPIYFTLYSNLGARVVVPLFYAVMFGMMVVGLGDIFARMIGVGGGGSPYMPDALDVRGVNAVYYESFRDADAPTTTPTIQSDVIEDPYVRLFIPLQPDRHDPWLRASCPGAEPLRSTALHLRSGPATGAGADTAAARVLTCLSQLHAVALDGVPRPDLAFRFYTHPGTGRDGIITYVPTATLGAGMHTITVRPPPRRPSSKNRTPLTPYEIPFWR